MTNKAIELENVYYSDGKQQIIRGVSGFFQKGKITTLVGPSGAGKTTLFRLCNGLISPAEGDIFIDSQHIDSYEPTALRRKVGLALQSAAMLPGTVHDNLSLPRTLTGEVLSKEEGELLLERVALEKTMPGQDIENLSGGQRQKVSIARTLINRPDILLMDEITSSLDRVSRQDIETLIQTINKDSHVTIIWITHNLEQAVRIGDDTWVMMKGERIESGPSSLLLDPKDERVRQFVKGDI